MSMYGVVSWGFAVTGVFFWQRSVSLCPASFVHQGPKLPIFPGISWFPTFAFQCPTMKRTSFFGVSSRRFCRSSKNWSAQLLWHQWWGTDLDVEWFVVKMNWDYYVIFENLPKFCILDFFVDNEGHSISSKGFLPTVVDIMVIWIKFTHSHPF